MLSPLQFWEACHRNTEICILLKTSVALEVDMTISMSISFRWREKFHYCFLIVQHLDKTEQYTTIPIAAQYFTFKSTVNNTNLCHTEAFFNTKIQSISYFVSYSASYKDITLVAIARSKQYELQTYFMLLHILH